MRAAVLVDYDIRSDELDFSSRFKALQMDRAEWPRSFVEAIHMTPQSEEYLESLTDAALSTPTNAAAIMLANLMLIGPTDLGPALDSLDRPAFFVFSSQGWAVDAAEEVRDGWPDVPVEVIDETSHALFVDRPEAFHRVLEAFLESLPPASPRGAEARGTGSDEPLARVPVPGGELEYEVRGDGEAVLFIHGSLIAGAFLPLMQAPALDDYRLVRYHRRGYADSADLEAPFGIEQQAADALAILRHLDIRRAHIVGHSYGAVVALQLAFDAPDVVHSLVLLEPPLMHLLPDLDEAPSSIAPAIEAYQAGDTLKAVETFAQLVGGPEWRARVTRTVPGAVQQAERDGWTFFEAELPAFGGVETGRRRSGTCLTVDAVRARG